MCWVRRTDSRASRRNCNRSSALEVVVAISSAARISNGPKPDGFIGDKGDGPEGSAVHTKTHDYAPRIAGVRGWGPDFVIPLAHARSASCQRQAPCEQ